jgi:hypothetical protein
LLPCAASSHVEDDPESIPTTEPISEGHKKIATCLHHAAVIILDGNDPGLPVKEGCLEIHSPTSTPLRRTWEAAVKSMKYHLRRTLGAQIATYEELYTLLTEIEACLNSRPICALSNDPHESTYLSPGHFLIGQPLT